MAQPAANPSVNDVTASLVLLVATLAALIIANSPAGDVYRAVFSAPFSLSLAEYQITFPLKVWIKDALMAIFFLFVGLEIKSEFLEGTLSERSRALLPIVAAVGGMVVPALIYLWFSHGDRDAWHGWAIPSATDIAFAVGVIGLLGRKVPPSLKAFLLAVAVIDDLGAILVIALFYTQSLSMAAIGLALLIMVGLALLHARRVERLWPYLVTGVLLWFVIQQSGLSPTLAGVIVALFIPLKGSRGRSSPLHHLVDRLKWPVGFIVMPVFAFAYAGVSFAGLTWADVVTPITLGVFFGLALGKPIGIGVSSLLVIWSGLAKMPHHSTVLQLFGASCIAGIGFTMSLFIGVLAFGDHELMTQVRIGVMAGSLCSAILGIMLLALGYRRSNPRYAKNLTQAD